MSDTTTERATKPDPRPIQAIEHGLAPTAEGDKFEGGPAGNRAGPPAESTLSLISRSAGPDARTRQLLRLQRAHGNQQVARMVQRAREEATQSAPIAAVDIAPVPELSTPVVQRAAPAKEPGFTERAAEAIGSAKASAYSWIIDKLRAAQQAGIGQLRALTRTMTPVQQVAAELIIGQLDATLDAAISLALAILGLIVGFVSGVVKLVWGLLSALEGLFEGIILFFAGFFGQEYRDRFNDWAAGVGDAIANIPRAVKALANRWLTEFKAANPDRQTIMIGEVTGEILALIASFLVGGEIAGPGAAAAEEAPAFAVAGGGTMARGGALTVPALGPHAAGVGLGTALASSIDQQNKSGGGAKDEPASSGPGDKEAQPGKTDAQSKEPSKEAELPNKELSRASDLAQRTMREAAAGKVREAPNYHGRLRRATETDILAQPDRVYVSEGKGGRFIFAKDGNVVVTEGAGSSRGQIVTSYGPAGPRGRSGAAIFGGAETEPGLPVTNEMIEGGTIPTPDGSVQPPATQIYP